MTFTLVDDGSLETVLECDDCQEEIRFDSGALLEGVYSINNEDWIDKARIQNAMAIAEDEHECEDET